MSTLAIAKVQAIVVNPETIEYLQRIDATLAPYEGRFVVHGGPVERIEGDWKGDLVILEFPDRDRARGWYSSDAYREIVGLRTRNMSADVIFIDGVPLTYRATDILC
ncbi:DUF1330 domain-containing protein [Roseateles noduli]|jgi:uncharacterized protein (DUF1330 family)|uniref:DUF1330 domain-containing protein n=1 Tax=Roseateles noduli TaxID=2052484 RepID=UPI003D64E90A